MTNSLHEQIRTSCVAFKEVLKQEIEYFKASGKFEDLENHQKKLKEIGLKPFFRLHPPRGGLKSSKKQFPRGVLGNHKQEINKLIEKML